VRHLHKTKHDADYSQPWHVPALSQQSNHCTCQFENASEHGSETSTMHALALHHCLQVWSCPQVVYWAQLWWAKNAWAFLTKASEKLNPHLVAEMQLANSVALVGGTQGQVCWWFDASLIVVAAQRVQIHPLLRLVYVLLALLASFAVVDLSGVMKDPWVVHLVLWTLMPASAVP
jgi:hypothetical protein